MQRCISDLESLGKRLASGFRFKSFESITIHSLRPWGIRERAFARLHIGDSGSRHALAALPAAVLSIDQEQYEESEVSQ